MALRGALRERVRKAVFPTEEEKREMALKVELERRNRLERLKSQRIELERKAALYRQRNRELKRIDRAMRQINQPPIKIKKKKDVFSEMGFDY